VKANKKGANSSEGEVMRVLYSPCEETIAKADALTTISEVVDVPIVAEKRKVHRQ
jgi:hypothetical protein